MSIKKNFIYNITYQILLMIAPLITTPYISRVIGPEGIGIQSYTLSIANYFVLFTMLGINNHGNRSIAMAKNSKKELSKVFWGIYYFQLFTGLIMSLIYIIYIIFFVKEYKMFFIIQGIYIISATVDINWLFFGLEEFKLTVIRNMIIKIASILSIFFIVKSNKDLYKYCLILALANLFSQLYLWKFIKGKIDFLNIKLKNIKIHIKPILILFIPVIAISMYKIMDKIMLGNMSNIIQVGFYENSEKIINIPMGIVMALATVMLPRMSNLQSNGDIEKSKEYINMSMEFVMLIAYGSMFGLIGISSIFVPIFLGNEFINCIEVVSVLSVTILFLAWANVIRTQFLIPNKRDKVYIISTILGALINLVINFIFIKKLGAIGAAIGTIFAEATVAVYQSFKVKNELNICMFFKNTIFYIIPGIIMLIVIKIIGYLGGKSLITGIFQVIIGGFFYFLICYIYMVRKKNAIGLYMKNKIDKIIGEKLINGGKRWIRK
ncbi:flippase [Clostridium perfringens]|uniref:flippase n=1 Tax=Clostridium perfringens TaxID=1502 RepID=UPI001FAEF082|nr:flippase [Clostridium perfringens]MDJ8959094.1 flippase [Clostridium perfringens]MDT7913797.1 flippase [Clostridium perfringens]MDT7926966.1 flippase [Clostridium perfringens]MDT7959341.1 flippase [Clostridium perfringens]MDT7975689.1 flippase [Clostridium perfringens]